MAKLRFLLCFLSYSIGINTKEFISLNHLRTQTSTDAQKKAVLDLIERKTPTVQSQFTIIIDSTIGPPNYDTFKYETLSSGKLVISASSGVAAAWGYYHYLRTYCDAHISWAGDQLNVPHQLPVVTSPVKVTSNDRFRYYQNVCTVSYSMVWWDWNRWEQEIDWMAMNGINLPLAFNGQEEIWQRVLLKMGFFQSEVDSFFSGPAFLAWFRMGNIQKWGGPLSQNWHRQQVMLQHKILDRMRSLGITPVLPAFAGHVPKNFTRIFPQANITQSAQWGRNWNSTYCCVTLLDFDDPIFPQISKAFLSEYIQEFGTNHIYNADSFNEMTPRSSSVAYLKSAGRSVFRGMLESDSKAVWLMQGWLFENDAGFWKPPQAKALLTSVPIGRMIVLDLYAEVSPQYLRHQSFYGQPFIWCMLHNFGGTMAMYGKVQTVNTGPFLGRAYPNSTMVGIGLTPEGINQNDVIYEFMLDNSFLKSPRNVTAWFENFALRRYGKQNEDASLAWQLLMKSVYNCSVQYENHSEDVVINIRPKLNPPIIQTIWYGTELVYQAWDHMLSASQSFQNNSLFRYDLADITRQSLQLIGYKIYIDIKKSYESKNISSLQLFGSKMISLLTQIDDLLGSDKHFLLGKWIESARTLGSSEAERQLLEYNARNQVSLWGPVGNIVDYANKHWSGLFSGYYRPRWQLFINELLISLQTKIPFKESIFVENVFTQVEQPFTFDRRAYPSVPSGDTISLSRSINQEFRPRRSN